MEILEHVRRLRVAADYFATPIWDLDVGGMVDLASLDIDDALRARVRAWADRYDSTMDHDDPMASGFDTPEAEAAFLADGRELARDLQAQLGPDVVVEYAPDH